MKRKLIIKEHYTPKKKKQKSWRPDTPSGNTPFHYTPSSSGSYRTNKTTGNWSFATPFKAAAAFTAGIWASVPIAAAAANIPLVGPSVLAPAITLGAGFGAAAYAVGPMTKKVSQMKINNSLVNQSAVKKVGKVKQKKNKTVKVSPYLKKAIKQVSAGDCASGEYVRHFNGMIGTWVTNIDATQPANTAGLAGGAVVLNPGQNRPAGGWTWWNILATYRQAATPTLLDQDLNFFTPGKILHAASLLWNVKAESVNPYIATGNIGTDVTLLTGAQVQAEQGSLKVNVTQSYCKILLKNLSARPAEVIMYEMVPKKKFSNVSPLGALNAAFLDITDDTVDKTFQYSYGTVANQSAPHLDGNFDPLPYVSKQFQWSTAKKIMVLAPGELIAHYVQGPTGVLDYGKLFNDGVYTTTGWFKDWSKAICFAVRPQPVLRIGTAAVTNGDRVAFYTGSPATGAMGMPISVEVTEVLRLKVPEIAGYLAAAGGIPGAGNPQTLNLRKHKIAYTSLVGINSLSEPVNNIVSVFPEQDPTSQVSIQGSI